MGCALQSYESATSHGFFVMYYGPEFVSRAVLQWLQQAEIETAAIDPGKPWQNGANESFNGKF